MGGSTQDTSTLSLGDSAYRFDTAPSTTYASSFHTIPLKASVTLAMFSQSGRVVGLRIPARAASRFLRLHEAGTGIYAHTMTFRGPWRGSDPRMARDAA